MTSLVVDAAASELRRALGPTSWVVLEELLLRSNGTPGECVASVSVRSLAATLGIAKDTVAQAIRRLRDSGLVTVAQHRTEGGIFVTGTYEIALPDGVTLVAPAQATPQPRASRRPTRRFTTLAADGALRNQRWLLPEPHTPFSDRQVPAIGRWR